MKRKALGKGLGALIPEAEAPETAPGEVDIDRIVPNPHQPRLTFDEASLEELAASIRENGVLQPVLVRPHGDRYQLVAGERRVLAAQRAGLLKVPVVVKDVPDDRLLILALVENIQREQLNPIEEAQAYHSLLEALRSTQDELAAHLGKERSTIANALRLLRLPPAVKLLVAEGQLSPGHGRALLASSASPAEMTRVAKVMVQKGWSVREAERWAKRRPKTPVAPVRRDPNTEAAEARLRECLGTKVEIVAHSSSGKSGQIRIHFYGEEELDRIFSILTGN